MRPHFLESLARAVARVASVAFVLVATLRVGGSEMPVGWTRCLACGDLATAEVIQNLLLFVPFGLAFGLGSDKTRRVVFAGFLFSLAVELVQHRLPGRDPSLADVFFNTLGTAGGVALARTAPTLLAPPVPWAPWLALTGALGAAAVIATTAALFQPATDPPAATLWTPDLPRLPRYRGRVTATTLGPLVLAPGSVPDPGDVAMRWTSGQPLVVGFVLGPPPGAFAPILALMTARDERQIVVGTAGDDLAFWPRTRAAALRLDQPDVRFRDALAGFAEGDTVRAGVERPGGRGGGRYCLALNAARRCGLGYGIDQGWTLVLYPESFPPWLQRTAGLLWLAALAWPLGVWWQRGWVSVTATVLLGVTVLLTPRLAGLVPTGIVEVLAVGAGVALGLLARRPLTALFGGRPAPRRPQAAGALAPA